MTDNMPSLGDLTTSAAIGAAAGITGVGVAGVVAKAGAKISWGVGAARASKTLGTVVGGAVAGGVQDATSQAVDGGVSVGGDGVTVDIDMKEVTNAAATGALLGGVGDVVGAGAKISEKAIPAGGVAGKVVNKTVDGILGEGATRALDSLDQTREDEDNNDESSGS